MVSTLHGAHTNVKESFCPKTDPQKERQRNQNNNLQNRMTFSFSRRQKYKKRYHLFYYLCGLFYWMKNQLCTLLLLIVSQIVMGQTGIFGIPCEDAPTVTDHEGNVYATVQFGPQCWMAENMRCMSSPSGKDWVRNPVFYQDRPVYKSYFVAIRDASYGNLYNWSAAMDLSINEYSFFHTEKQHRGICPSGWHIPSSDEWALLLESLGGSNKAGAVMKCHTSKWIKPVIAEQVSGFGAIPAGIYTEEGLRHTGNYAYFWSATTYDRQNAWGCGLFSYNSDCYNILDYKCYGRSVRCLKDEPEEQLTNSDR